MLTLTITGTGAGVQRFIKTLSMQHIELLSDGGSESVSVLSPSDDDGSGSSSGSGSNSDIDLDNESQSQSLNPESRRRSVSVRGGMSGGGVAGVDLSNYSSAPAFAGAVPATKNALASPSNSPARFVSDTAATRGGYEPERGKGKDALHSAGTNTHTHTSAPPSETYTPDSAEPTDSAGTDTDSTDSTAAGSMATRLSRISFWLLVPCVIALAVVVLPSEFAVTGYSMAKPVAYLGTPWRCW